MKTRCKPDMQTVLRTAWLPACSFLIAPVKAAIDTNLFPTLLTH